MNIFQFAYQYLAVLPTRLLFVTVALGLLTLYPVLAAAATIGVAIVWFLGHVSLVAAFVAAALLSLSQSVWLVWLQRGEGFK